MHVYQSTSLLDVLQVSILTRPEGRVQLGNMEAKDYEVDSVSILTRPGGGVQLTNNTGANVGGGGFNPHPSRRTGATRHHQSGRDEAGIVSILTRPGGRVQPAFVLYPA